MSKSNINYDKKINQKIVNFLNKKIDNSLEACDYLNLFDCLNLYAMKYELDKYEWFRIKDSLFKMKFYFAKASRNYHCNFDGGLLIHTLNIIQCLEHLTKVNNLKWCHKRSPFIVGLCHDLCKATQYELNVDLIDTQPQHYIDTDNIDNHDIEVDLYNGHGSKSAMIASTMLILTKEELACIRYHMGQYSNETQKDEADDVFHKAMNYYPNVFWTHVADMWSSQLIEDSVLNLLDHYNKYII